MSGIAGIFNVPSTQEELNTWSATHATHHLDIINAIQRLTGTQLQQFVLDPIDATDAEGWLLQHQQMHNDMDAILGIAGYNLLDVDLKDQNQFAGWIWLNSQEHYQAANILEIG